MTNQARVLRRRKRADEEDASTNQNVTGGEGSTYEEFRQRRIKENSERMHTLGIFDLSLNLKSLTAPTTKTSQYVKRPKSLPLSTSLRRSSRLTSGNPVDYSVSNFYKTIYDPENGESCHQCRHKTRRIHTHCSSCKARQGQFCGTCLYTRYGEDVIEVNKNANWVCPVCRGICNCYRCRKGKGFAPTGPICKKVSELGFKSVAHYLIHIQQVKTQPEDTGVEISESEERELSSLDRVKMEEEEQVCCSDAMKQC
ncbi:uncharacterized protein [Euphorbia lathyris]|uniref:uncharacterized protein n=1 Tax=Euphorbia lathyris TaxID=212925 RepID=UPI003313509B